MDSKKEKIKAAIKELGYNPNKDVTIRENRCGYDWSFTITIRNPIVNFNAINNIAKTCQVIHRDERSFEVLGGANVWIDTKIKDEVAEIWTNENIEKVSNAITELKKLDEHNRGMDIDDRYVLFYAYNSYYYQVWDRKNNNWFHLNYYSPESIALDIYINNQI